MFAQSAECNEVYLLLVCYILPCLVVVYQISELLKIYSMFFILTYKNYLHFHTSMLSFITHGFNQFKNRKIDQSFLDSL
ncbi:hypothetical protein BNATCHR1103 (nucleomorph) [Bigelowiella natans]|uniref:Uncharacterized protein n=1 Tax=Bigelowiella natans TaxID=227086 RepID=Q3LWH4_BIGNA|nr:hypothetical protein BNATCHR1103 [Bigelowiella natans]ABA27192.1 hypothetical protein [Bigelowiella natans]